MGFRTDPVVQNDQTRAGIVSHNQCTKLHDGSDLGYHLGVCDPAISNPRPTSKAPSPTPTSPAQAPGPRRIGGPARGPGRLRRGVGEVGYPPARFAAERSSVDAGRSKPITEPVTACG